MKEHQLISPKTSNLKPLTSPMKYVFFGTPDFAAIILGRLIDADMAPTVLVCNPDRPVGRDKIITPPLTKQLAQERGPDIKIFQPEDKKELVSMSDEIFNDVDFGIVAAYSQIISKEVINMTRLGIIGVHPSLLPKYRGSTPIQSVILGGDDKTGVTLYLLDEKVDNGPILANRELKMENQSYEELMRELAELSGDLLIEILPKFVSGNVEAVAQDGTLATLTNKFFTENAYIDPEDLAVAENGDKGKASEISRKIRALNPEPGTYTFIDGKRTKLLAASIEGYKLVLKKIQKEGKTPIDL